MITTFMFSNGSTRNPMTSKANAKKISQVLDVIADSEDIEDGTNETHT